MISMPKWAQAYKIPQAIKSWNLQLLITTSNQGEQKTYWWQNEYLLSHPFLDSKTILGLDISLSTHHCRQEPNCELDFLWPSQHLIILQNRQYACIILTLSPCLWKSSIRMLENNEQLTAIMTMKVTDDIPKKKKKQKERATSCRSLRRNSYSNLNYLRCVAKEMGIQSI